MDISALPTLDDQKEITAARQVVKAAKERHRDLKEKLRAAEEIKAAAAEQTDEMRISLAVGDVEESDLDAAKNDAKAAAEKVEDLTAEIEEQRQTVDRLKPRLDAARQNSIDAIVDDYATASVTLQKKKIRAMKALASALEEIHAFREKQSINGLRRDERLVALSSEVRVYGGKRVGPSEIRGDAVRLEKSVD